MPISDKNPHPSAPGVVAGDETCWSCSNGFGDQPHWHPSSVAERVKTCKDECCKDNRPKVTRPITCPCEAFDRDVSDRERCYCGHAYSQHSEADDGLPCVSTAPNASGGDV